jgi:hypothetical protein
MSAQGEYRPLIVAAREAKRWDLVRDLITERARWPEFGSRSPPG